jgi:Ssp1 endopeptidase immunity protein Rap1a
MLRSLCKAVFLAAFLASPTAHALSGNDWDKLAELQQTVYVSGVVDTWRNFAALQKEDPSKPGPASVVFRKAYDCIAPDVTYRQLRVVVAKWMGEHPDQWDRAMASIVWTAVVGLCEGK